MSFKKMRGLPLTYNEQGYIYFVCKTYYSQPQETQEKIKRVCAAVAHGRYTDVVFKLMTGSKGMQVLSLDEGVSVRSLYGLRAEFYMKWNKY